MIEEALQHLAAQAVRAEKPTIISVPDFPREVFICHGGDLRQLQAPPPLRNLTAHDLRSLALLVHMEMTHAAVYVGKNTIWAVLDRDDRRETVTMRLEYAPTFSALTELAEGWKKYADTVELARDLRDLGVPQDTAAPLAKVDFDTRRINASSAGRGKESVDKSVLAETIQGGNIPRSIVVPTPVYTNRGCREPQAVTVMIHLAPLEGSIQLRTDAATLVTAQELATDTILHQLRLEVEQLGDDVPLYSGHP